MAIRWMEGFDVVRAGAGAIAAAELDRRYDVGAYNGTDWETVAGRTGGLALKVVAMGSAGKLETPRFTRSLYWTVGMAIKMRRGNGELIRFCSEDSAVDEDDIMVVSLEPTTVGPPYDDTRTTISIKRGATVLGTYVFDFDDQWVYMEVEAQIQSTATQGAFVNLWINGVKVLQITGVATADTGDYTNYVVFKFAWANGTGHMYVDDLYVAGGIVGIGSAALPPGVLGDAVVQEALPDGAGDTVDATAVGAATVHECMDDPTGETDDDVTYAELTGLDKKVLQTFPAFSDQGEAVVAIELEEFARTTAGSAVQHRPIDRRGTDDGEHDTTQTVPVDAAYTRLSHIMEVDPITGEDWVFADLVTTQFGYQQE